jgi:N-acetylglucosamine kinase-like BadF-type ATPase
LTEISGIPMTAVTRTCIGTAGESVPLVADWLREAFAARVAGERESVGDVEIALDAAFPGQPGVLVLAGTGSNVAGRTPSGALTSAGGWGPVLGDEGSGYRIGFDALGAMFLAHDEGRSTLLTDAVLELWRMSSLDQLVEFANRTPTPDLAQLTEPVLRCAERGDAVALEVLNRQGEQLAHLVRLVVHRLRAASGDPAWLPPIAFAGSIMERVAPVRRALEASVRGEFPAIRMLEGVVDPLCGALWRARRGSVSS